MITEPELPYGIDNLKVPDNGTGILMLDVVRDTHAELRKFMASRDFSKEEYVRLTDLSYDFKKLRQEIQRQMTAIFLKSKRKDY